MSEQQPSVPPPQPVKKGCIVGTAPTYKNTPWDDPSVDVLSLNDAYVLPGFQRATAWFDLHPIPEMVFRPKGERRVDPVNAPVGGYLRPEGHLEWLKTRQFPVYLHDCRECGCQERLEAWKRGELPRLSQRPHDPYPFPAWPNARPFPFQAVQKQYGQYFQSTPAWMLAWMLMEQYRAIGIFGIHLATEWEYIHQRPNMEFLIGMALPQGVAFTIPEKSTLLRGKHQYAVEPKPHLDQERIERTIYNLKHEGAQWRERLASLPWHARAQKADILARLRALDLEVMDARQEQMRLASLARVA